MLGTLRIIRRYDSMTLSPPCQIRPFCILLALALLTALILQPGSALDSRSSGEACSQWTVDDTLRIVVMSDIDISPDASMVAYVVKRPVMTTDESRWQHQIFVTEWGGNNTFPLTDGKSSSYDPQWSPDGRYIAFLSDRSGDDNMRSSSDGRYLLARITQGNFSVLDWDWSPDGKCIAFSHAESPEPADEFFSDISTVDLETGKVTSLVKIDAMEKSPLYSPDGRWIAYCASDLPPADLSAFWVYLVPVGGGLSRRLAETPDQKPHLLGWSEDGKLLYLWEYRNTTTVISALPSDGSEPVDLSAQGGGGVMDEIRMDRAKTTVGFTFQNSSVPPEVYVSGVEGFSPERVSGFNDGLPLQALGRTEIVRWNSSDGQRVEGLLTYPADYRPGVRYPLLLVIHGGPASTSSQDFIGGSTFYPMSYFYPYSAFSSQGYVILRPNPRGSGGYGAVFRKANIRDWGGMDYRDLMSGVDFMVKKGLADPDRMGIMGWSYGGFLTAWAVTASGTSTICTLLARPSIM